METVHRISPEEISQNTSTSLEEVYEAIEKFIELGLLIPVEGSSGEYKMMPELFHPHIAAQLCHILPALEPYAKRKLIHSSQFSLKLK